MKDKAAPCQIDYLSQRKDCNLFVPSCWRKGESKLLAIKRSLLEKIFYCLVKTPGISGTELENLSSNVVVECLREMSYFKEHPHYLNIFPLKNDIFKRKVVSALVKGIGRANETIVLLGHSDVVDVQDYGKNSDVAFEPEELVKRINPDFLSPETRKDFLSGEWIFGRGVMDMRCGVAVAMAVLEAASRNPEALKGNLLFLCVPDEENNSLGMIAATENLLNLAKKYDLDYLACIDGEPQFPKYPNDDNKYIYQGTLGKFVLMAYCVGKETHGGDPLAGLNANLIIAELTRRIELNMDLSDYFDDVVVPPPTSLKQADTKEYYSIKTPESAYAYYNFLTVDQSPRVFFERVHVLAREAIAEALDKRRRETKRFLEMTGKQDVSCSWTPKVFSYSELVSMANEDSGEVFHAHMDKCYEKWSKQSGLDQRMLALEIVREVHKFCGDQDPKIILLYVPAYYPHIKPSNDTPRWARAAEVVNQVADFARSEFNEEVFVEKFFPGLCDLSYVCLQNAEDVITNIRPNMPNWGFSYELPVETIKKLNIPVMNIGPYGKDAHKNTERLHMDYSFRVYPALLAYAIEQLFFQPIA